MPDARDHKSALDAPEGAPAQERPQPAALAQEAMVLPLDILIPDAEGRIALIEDMGRVPIAIATKEAVEKEGVAEAGTRAGGLDVAGYRYLQFASGVTLYFPEGTDLTVVSE